MNGLIEEVLKDVADDKAVGDQGEFTVPLATLISAYNRLTYENQDAPRIRTTTSALELKTALAKLVMKDQIRLLHLYTDFDNTPTYPPQYSEDPAVTEERRLKHWLIKGVFWCMAPIPPMIVGMMLVIRYERGDAPDNAVISGLMATATEILKVIITM